MTRQLQDDHLKATNIANLYHTLNENTQYEIQPRSDSDVKKKIWRIGVVKRDDRANEISKHLSKAARQEPRKTPKKAQNIKAAKKPITQKIVKITPLPVSENSRYKPSKKPGKLKKDTLIATAWDLRIKGKNYTEIADIMGISRDKIGRYIYARKKQLNIHVERVKTVRGHFHPDTKAQQIWDYHKQGLSNNEIVDKMDVSPKYVSGTICRRRKFFNETRPKNKVTQQVLELKKNNKSVKQIAEELNITEDKAKYHYYKKTS
ncbi:hypothetical protein [uncultured Chryseobacterium sp.]|uniref:helix-turn-helix transcriptional regulator n=1 Tax=uncultured Chryseobacterium sp. TaxID=259322 RepID=UPI0025E7AFFB|nr:hypothetical protein [uncultured Chryseobacterium sp.]